MKSLFLAIPAVLLAALTARHEPGTHGDPGGDGGTHANTHSGTYAYTGPQCRAGL